MTSDEHDDFWDSSALADAARTCAFGEHTHLHGDERGHELLRGITLALLAQYEQNRECGSAVLAWLRTVGRDTPAGKG